MNEPQVLGIVECGEITQFSRKNAKKATEILQPTIVANEIGAF